MKIIAKYLELKKDGIHTVYAVEANKDSITFVLDRNLKGKLNHEC